MNALQVPSLFLNLDQGFYPGYYCCLSFFFFVVDRYVLILLIKILIILFMYLRKIGRYPEKYLFFDKSKNKT